MSLRAPMAVPVEVRSDGSPTRAGAVSAETRRVFRLSASVGEDGVRLVRPAPFDVGRPVAVAFTLPDGEAPLVARAEVTLAGDDGEGERGGSELAFLDAPADVRLAIHRYVANRLGIDI